MDTITFFTGCITGSFLTILLVAAIIIIAISKTSGQVIQREREHEAIFWNGR